MNRRSQAAARLAEETRQALQLVYDALNQGQQQKLMKNEQVRALFERYGVGCGEGSP